MKIRVSFIKKSMLTYLSAPFLLFLGAWVRPLISLPCAALFLYALRAAMKTHDDENQSTLTLSKTAFALIALIVLLWGYCAGQGGFFYQSPDYHYRNAVFRDMIFYPWPVLYAAHKSALVYYLAHWLVPASVAKLFLFAGASARTVWAIGNISLLLWGAAGVFLTVLLMIHTLKARSAGKKTLCLLMLIFFSGMDAVGAWLLYGGLAAHIEWWAQSYQYSSLTTCMFWVFNQTIAPWMIVMMLFSRQDVRNFAFTGLLCLFFAPFPFVCLTVYYIAFAARGFIRAYRGKAAAPFLKRVFSVQNVVASLVIFPLTYLYYGANTAINAGRSEVFVAWRFLVDPNWFNPYAITVFACFLLLEFGFLCMALFRDEKRDLFFQTTLFCLILIPFIQVGESGDFVMRASIPALFVLMLIATRRLFQVNLKSARGVALVLCLAIGVVTPAVEFARAFTTIAAYKRADLTADAVVSLGLHVGKADLRNFVRLNADETAFYKYIARLPNAE